MATIRVRDPYGNTREVDATARPFWEGREGCQILDASGAGTSPAKPAEPEVQVSAPRSASSATQGSKRVQDAPLP